MKGDMFSKNFLSREICGNLWTLLLLEFAKRHNSLPLDKNLLYWHENNEANLLSLSHVIGAISGLGNIFVSIFESEGPWINCSHDSPYFSKEQVEIEISLVIGRDNTIEILEKELSVGSPQFLSEAIELCYFRFLQAIYDSVFSFMRNSSIYYLLFCAKAIFIKISEILSMGDCCDISFDAYFLKWKGSYLPSILLGKNAVGYNEWLYLISEKTESLLQ